MNHSQRAVGDDFVLPLHRELLNALDRHVAHLKRRSETRHAREAVALRNDAATRIAQLAAEQRTHDACEAGRSHAVMADDGGPLRTDQEQPPTRSDS